MCNSAFGLEANVYPIAILRPDKAHRLAPITKQWFERVKAAGEPALNAADKEALVNIVSARTGKSKEEATQIVDNYAQAYQQAMQKFEELKQQAEQKAREAGEIAAKQISRAAWSTLAMLLLGAALSFFVGRMALANRRIPTA
jgi:ElaB/YqjD/DUF883 family membrane-anchored ribosome-binding protein